MADKRVVVKGGGENLYYVSESSGTYYVYKGSVWSGKTQIGKARSMSDALAIITSYSGRAIESIG
jgi:hypothetical protein